MDSSKPTHEFFISTGHVDHHCLKCNRNRPATDFAIVKRKSGKWVLNSRCRECIREQERVYSKSEKVKTYRREYQRTYVEQNPEKTQDYKRKSYLKNQDRVRARKQTKAAIESQKRYAKTYRERHKDDMNLRLRNQLRCRIYNVFRDSGISRNIKSNELIGCDMDVFKQHLESLFQPGMNWENYGTWKRGEPMRWQIDHIVPCSSFDLTDPEQQRKCFHYTNTQPLWAIDNYTKNDSIDWSLSKKKPDLSVRAT